MLLPSGRWNCHCRVEAGRCYSQLADVIALVNCYNFSSEMLNRTSSQMCGRWYLPIFLLRDGSLTLIYRASFMALVAGKTFSSDLRKPCLITGESLSPPTKNWSCS